MAAHDGMHILNHSMDHFRCAACDGLPCKFECPWAERSNCLGWVHGRKTIPGGDLYQKMGWDISRVIYLVATTTNTSPSHTRIKHCVHQPEPTSVNMQSFRIVCVIMDNRQFCWQRCAMTKQCTNGAVVQRLHSLAVFLPYLHAHVCLYAASWFH